MLQTDCILQSDSLKALQSIPADSVHCCVTSPPYYALRDYGIKGQIGREDTPEQYITRLADVFREVYRVLRPDGTLWLNISDTYCGTGSKGSYVDPKYTYGRTGQHVSITRFVSGCKPKDLIGIPWLLAFTLRNDGWYLRQDIIWHKPNPMPESVKDRCTRAHEYMFLLSKSARYFFDNKAIKETATSTDDRPRDRETTRLNKVPGRTRMNGLTVNDYIMRNKRDVWTIVTKPYKGAHFAVFPPDLIEPCILAGCPSGGIVLDPFFGSGTTGIVAKRNGRRYIGIDINAEYCRIARQRLDSA